MCGNGKRYLKLSEVSEADIGIYYFGIMISNLENEVKYYWRRKYRARSLYNVEKCEICGSVETLVSVNGVKTWRRIDGKIACHMCFNRRIVPRGRAHPQWRWSNWHVRYHIMQTGKYRDWRNSIFSRDSYTCQNCGKYGGKLEAHHIKKFSVIIRENNINTVDEALECDDLWDKNNGITLCVPCHKAWYKMIRKILGII